MEIKKMGHPSWAFEGLLKDKVAVVTGAARGIGRATAVALDKSGAQIVGIDICDAVDPRSGVTPPREKNSMRRKVSSVGWFLVA
jgi:NAD(P)-dependent dehydrogenase (short-subunit alcohol dehydrogenase family)